MQTVCLLLVTVPLRAELSSDQRVDVFEAVWQAVDLDFYDPAFRGVDWAGLQEEQRGLFRSATSDLEVEARIRALMGLLGNSHMGLLSPEDRRLRRGVLPFLFGLSQSRAFVLESRAAALRLGDEILTVDGRPASSLRLPLPRYLEPLRENPYFGEIGSRAEIQLRRDGRPLSVEVNRVQRGEAFDGWRREDERNGITALRIREMLRGEAMIRALRETNEAQGLVLDLRDSPGGFPDSSGPLLSVLLGPDRVLGQIYSREDGKTTSTQSTSIGFHYEGPVAVLINEFTASEGEYIAAVLQDYSRVHILGTKSNGAWNGWSKSVDLPHALGMIAVPYTARRTPKGRDLEGVGVSPDEEVLNSPEDLATGRDRVLELALAYLERDRQQD